MARMNYFLVLGALPMPGRESQWHGKQPQIAELPTCQGQAHTHTAVRLQLVVVQTNCRCTIVTWMRTLSVRWGPTERGFSDEDAAA